MKYRNLFALMAVLCSFSVLSAFALTNAGLKSQMYNTIKNKPYFNTQKVFVDTFIEKLDKLNFSVDSASWRAIDKQYVVDESSFKEVDGVYYMVFKSIDNAIIGLVRFKCKTPSNGGFKKIESYNYLKYSGYLDVDVNRFNIIEEAACE